MHLPYTTLTSDTTPLMYVYCYAYKSSWFTEMHTLTNENSFFKQNFSSAVKTIISVLIMAQTAVSSAFTAILYKTKKNFAGYGVREKMLSLMVWCWNNLFYFIKDCLAMKWIFFLSFSPDYGWMTSCLIPKCDLNPIKTYFNYVCMYIEWTTVLCIYSLMQCSVF